MTMDSFLCLYPLYKKLLQVIWHFCILELQKGWVWNGPLGLSGPILLLSSRAIWSRLLRTTSSCGFNISKDGETRKPFRPTCSLPDLLHKTSSFITCLQWTDIWGRTQYGSKGKLWKRTGWETVFYRKKYCVNCNSWWSQLLQRYAQKSKPNTKWKKYKCSTSLKLKNHNKNRTKKAQYQLFITTSMPPCPLEKKLTLYKTLLR